MDTSNLMIFQELNQEEFDFDSLLNNKDYMRCLPGYLLR